jgi:hypothetical protein
MTKTSARYYPEVRARAVHMALNRQADHPSQWPGFRGDVQVHSRDQGLRDETTTEERFRRWRNLPCRENPCECQEGQGERIQQVRHVSSHSVLFSVVKADPMPAVWACM